MTEDLLTLSEFCLAVCNDPETNVLQKGISCKRKCENCAWHKDEAARRKQIPLTRFNGAGIHIKVKDNEETLLKKSGAGRYTMYINGVAVGKNIELHCKHI